MTAGTDAQRMSISSPAAAHGRRTVEIEIEALGRLAERFGEDDFRLNFEQAVDLIVSVTGRVIVTGMGKSGLVARKIAATFASTGTPSFYIHPGDASHGDLGMITMADVVLAFSWSGETPELLDILNYCARFGVPLVAVTAHRDSALGNQASSCLTLPLVREACPNQLAPTSSTTMQAALGDALAVAAVEAKGFSSDDFRVFHPRGKLGAQLLRMGDLMSTGPALPRVHRGASIAEATLEMSAKRFGITAVTDDGDRLIGAFSDGDLRRSLSVATIDAAVDQHMTSQPFTMSPDELASEGLAMMNARSISQIFVAKGGRVIGIVHLHDVLRAGVV